MKQIHTLVDQLLLQTKGSWQVTLRAQWPVIMGDLHKRARLERVQGTTVVIGVYDSHWMHELHALSRMIVQRINGALAPLYPTGFTLTTVRCIWVCARSAPPARSDRTLDDRTPHMVVRKPTYAAINAVQVLSDKALQDALLSYYGRLSNR